MSEHDMVLDAPEVEADETYVGAQSSVPGTRVPDSCRKRSCSAWWSAMVDGSSSFRRGQQGQDNAAAARKISASMLRRSTRTDTRYTCSHSRANTLASNRRSTTTRRTPSALRTPTRSRTLSACSRRVSRTFHHVSKKHLARYCNEFSYRFNRRKDKPEAVRGDCEAADARRETALQDPHGFDNIGVLEPRFRLILSSLVALASS